MPRCLKREIGRASTGQAASPESLGPQWRRLVETTTVPNLGSTSPETFDEQSLSAPRPLGTRDGNRLDRGHSH